MKLLLTVFISLGMLSAFAQSTSRPRATLSDVAYGSHERNELDLWKASSSKPTPVLIFFHGGGFRSGNKAHIHTYFNVQEYLDKGISCISINYPFFEHTNNSHLEIFRHCENAVEYIKRNASFWNIDLNKMTLSGTSAGALISQYLGFRRTDINSIAAFAQPYGTKYFVIPYIKKSSPPIMIYQDSPLTDKVHHPKYANMVKETCDKNKSECIIYGTGENSIQALPEGKEYKEVMMNFLFEKWSIK